MMNLQRLSPAPAPLLRSAILATGIVGLLATSAPEGIQNAGAVPREDVSTSSDELGQSNAAMSELADAVAGALTALDKPEAVFQTASINLPDVPSTESAPLQVDSANPSNIELGNPGNVINSIELTDECPVADICIDRYLWALYQRTPKEDTIKVPERRKVSIKRRGKMVTVTRIFTKLVDEDFGWKDPKAAERVRMSMADYVIGGMDRSFKLKLFHMVHAAEAAGLSPGITSAFRDDYRQSIASGLKAASNKSFHGGSSRGGYGHGLAADIVSVQGVTRDERWTSSEKLWKWVDAHGKEFGIGRPYLNRDPPHVAPVDGREYAAHSRDFKQARSDVKKVKRVATRD